MCTPFHGDEQARGQGALDVLDTYFSLVEENELLLHFLIQVLNAYERHCYAGMYFVWDGRDDESRMLRKLPFADV